MRPYKVSGLTEQRRAFAVLVASGRKAADAYRQVYSAGKRGGKTDALTIAKRAHTLLRVPEVASYVAQLRERAGRAAEEAVAQSAVVQAATKVALTREYVIGRLTEVVERCMQHQQVLTKAGKPVVIETASGEMAAAFTFDAKGANGALSLLGKEIGMFVERREVRHGPLAAMPEAELDAELAKLTREVADLTGKPIAEVMKQSLRAELAIDVTPAEPAPPRPLAPVLALASDDDATPGGVLERAADGTQ